jgi:hypothetical protein
MLCPEVLVFFSSSRLVDGTGETGPNLLWVSMICRGLTFPWVMLVAIPNASFQVPNNV